MHVLGWLSAQLLKMRAGADAKRWQSIFGVFSQLYNQTRKNSAGRERSNSGEMSPRSPRSPFNVEGQSPRKGSADRLLNGSPPSQIVDGEHLLRF
jgi:hypothetical protein